MSSLRMRGFFLFFTSTARYSKLAAPDFEAIYNNPCLRLQQYLDIPVITETDTAFYPDVETMQKALELFVPKPGHEIKKILGTSNSLCFPNHDLPEVTFLGRSNAGKSSLLKAMLRDLPKVDHLVKTSKKPGFTKSANFYQIGEKLCLVDMPGYGYHEPKYFDELVGDYLSNRKNLRRTFLLIDGKVGFTTADETAFDMLEQIQVPYSIVMTKIDKPTDAVLLRNFLYLQQIRDKYSSTFCYPQVHMVSSHTLEGLAHLLSFIAHVTGNLAASSTTKSS